MIPIAIRIDAGEKLCKNCHLKRWSYRDWECPAFQETLNVDENLGIVRLPQCLSASADLKRLVEAVRLGLKYIEHNEPPVQPNGPHSLKDMDDLIHSYWEKDLDKAKKALKPFEDSPKEEKDA